MSVYKIYDKNNEEQFYIGSTNDFNNRKKGHKVDYKRSNHKLYNYIRNNGGWDCFNIVVLEHCLNYEEKEIELIKQLHPPLNTILYEDNWVNKEFIKEYNKIYNEKNKEKIKTQRKKNYYYKNSWGGDPRFNNNLLNIDINLLT